MPPLAPRVTLSVMRFAVVAHRASETNRELVAAWPGADSRLLTPTRALEELRAGDVALARLDVRETLDGVERGVRTLGRLGARGVRVLNPPAALLASHDKLITAARLRRAGIPHPPTWYVAPGGRAPHVTPPVVVKPRFGSWGRDIFLCESGRALDRCVRSLGARPWFQRNGALVQELVLPQGYDVRIVVAGGEIVGSIKRVAAAGEWRTNVALGARRHRLRPTPVAKAIALAAARAVDGDLVGVDLLPDGRGGYVVIEVNGAVEFSHEYAPDGAPFEAAVRALAWTGGSAAQAL